ncbi:hypothetical protein ACFT5B_01195 [Luteimicrobium sp. NPDC057192]|uniref:hypothetical protein n=1 Tax=Luteimicrobium sp. NPDC057192 TaxID=3346042 RepID=UPI0036368D5E
MEGFDQLPGPVRRRLGELVQESRASAARAYALELPRDAAELDDLGSPALWSVAERARLMSREAVRMGDLTEAQEYEEAAGFVEDDLANRRMTG